MAKTHTSVMDRRWAFWQKFEIRKPGEAVYLRRWYVIMTPWWSIYLHHILSPDPDRDPHDHPWDFGSFVLSGGYQEYAPEGCYSYSRWSWHTKKATDLHRITHVCPNTRTLVFTGPRKREWGFLRNGRWIPWREYLSK